MWALLQEICRNLSQSLEADLERLATPNRHPRRSSHMGLDVAREFVKEQLLALQAGCAVLLFVQDLDELSPPSDHTCIARARSWAFWIRLRRRLSKPSAL